MVKLLALTLSCMTLIALFVASTRTGAQSEASAWEFVRGGFKYVEDLAVIGPDDIWGVGTGGIFHFDGVDWKVVHEDWSVESIAMAGDGTGWAISSAGLLHYDGAAWRPADGYAHNMVLTGPGNGWGIGVSQVGDRLGTRLIRLEGDRWIPTDHIIPGYYTDGIAVVDDSDIWLVGSTGIAHFDGTVLSSVLLGRDVWFRDVSFTDSKNGWAVGGTCEHFVDQQRVVLHFEGQSWKTVFDSATGDILQRVVALSATEAIAGDNAGHVLRIRSDGSLTEFAPAFASGGDHCDGGVMAIEKLAEDGSVMVAGNAGMFSSAGAGAYLMRFADNQLTRVHGRQITSLDMVSDQKGWALAEGDVLKYDGDRWTTLPHGPTRPKAGNPNDIVATRDGSLVTVGDNGLIAEFNGTSWRQQRTSEREYLNRVVEARDGSLWVIGIRYLGDDAETFVLSRKNESENWVEVATVRGAHGEDIGVIGDSDVWVVGREGFVLHGDSGRWANWRLTTPQYMSSVSVMESGEGWVTVDGSWEGSIGEILTLRHNVLDSDERMAPGLHPKLKYLDLASVHAVSATDAWAVGIDSNILHFQDSRWQHDRSYGRGDGSFMENRWQLWDVDVVPGPGDRKTVWAVGDSETIMRREYRDEGSPVPTAPIGGGTVTPLPSVHSLYLPYTGQK